MQLKRLMIWLKMLCLWALEWRYFFYGLLLPGGSLFLFHLFQSSADEVSVVGLILQLLAICTVWYDIQDKLKQVGKKSIWQVWTNRFASFPPLRTVPVEMRMEGSIDHELRGGLELNVGYECTNLEECFRYLQQRIDHIQKELNHTQKRTKQELSIVKGEVLANLNSLTRVDQDLSTKMDKLAIDGLPVVGMGTFWLFCGVIFSSIPKSIIHICQYF